MANTLLESYKGRLSISEQYYAQKNNGAKMSSTKKMIVAQCLENTARYINEGFANSVGTQRSDLGLYKRFCLDITTLTVPNLIVNDLFIVQPMSSFSGYLTYMQFGLGTAKGGVGEFGSENEVITQDPFIWSQMTEARMAYTGERVVEAVAAGEAKVSWLPVVGNKVRFIPVEGEEVELEVVDGKVNAPAEGKIAYMYDNQIVPQDKLPTLVGRMQGITLTARARRIAIQYSQFAAFQSKQDYGIDFESTIAQQAQAELAYEIDSEAVFMIKNAADKYAPVVEWIDEELDTISYSMKAEGFARKIEQAKAEVYKKTGRYMPNWMLVSPDMMPIITFVPGFQAASNSIANGPYVAGTLGGMKVIVSPALGEKVCYLGVLGADGKTAVGVYAPYMPIVPTQLLGFADGMMSQGFSTLYDMKILNPALLAKISVKNGDDAARIFLAEGSEF